MLETPVSHTTITRTQLYELVWTTPIQKLATRFGLSDVGLAKVCKRHKIPRPPRGYWAKLANGKRVRKFPLSEVKDPSLEEVHFADRGTAAVASPRAEKQLAVDPAIADLIAAESLPDHRIEVATDLRGADPLVQATREALQQAEPDDYGRVSRRWDFPKPCFEVCVGRASAQRALLILHSLVRAFKVRGYKLVEKSDSSGWAGCEVLLIPALLIAFQFSPAEEGFEEWRPEVLVVEGLADQVAEVECIVGHPVGQVRVLGMVPDRFDRVQIGRVRRQPLDAQPVGSLLLELSYG